MSSTMESSILRKVSAWRASRLSSWKRSILVTPSIRAEILEPNRDSICSCVTDVSSTTSWSRPAATVVVSRRSWARMRATSTMCWRNGSPDLRIWPAWASWAKW